MKKEDNFTCLVSELSALDLVPYRKPCPGHNSCMHDIETMCHEQGRTLACLVSELSALDIVPYSKPCQGHNS